MLSHWKKDLIDSLGDELFAALESRRVVEPISDRHPKVTLSDAYRISQRFLSQRLDRGETVVGKKIGLTSEVVQQALGVSQPDFGYITDRMMYLDGTEMPISEELIQPKAEGEIAFVLKQNLEGPGVTANDVMVATDYVVPCFEVVDSRVENWRIKIQDTIADNASCGLLILGSDGVDPQKVDFFSAGMVVETNDKVVATGAAAAALGSPLNCVAWLANALSEYEVPLKAGEVVLSGSLVPFCAAEPGNTMKVTVGGLGAVTVHFT